MASEYYTRAQLVQLEIGRLMHEAKHCRNLERLSAIEAEMTVLYESMLEIRREQLRAELPRPRGRRWWQFWREREREVADG